MTGHQPALGLRGDAIVYAQNGSNSTAETLTVKKALAVTAGIKTLEHLKQPGNDDRLEAITKRLGDGIQEGAHSAYLPISAMLECAVYLPPGAFKAGFTSLSYSDDDIDATVWPADTTITSASQGGGRGSIDRPAPAPAHSRATGAQIWHL